MAYGPDTFKISSTDSKINLNPVLKLGPDTNKLLAQIDDIKDNTYDTLNVTYLHITNLPELPEFLKYLICSYTNITVLPYLPEILETLSCNYTKITSLPKLPKTLIKLSCFGTNITVLPNLPKFLDLLDCSNTSITILPDLPNSLRYLNCSNTPLTSLPKLPNSLRYLSCSNTLITSLPELHHKPAQQVCDFNPIPLSGIETLYCSNTKITVLPNLPKTLTLLSCFNTPLIIQRNFNESIHDYNQRWNVWRGEQAYKARCKEFCQYIKDELLVATTN